MCTCVHKCKIMEVQNNMQQNKRQYKDENAMLLYIGNAKTMVIVLKVLSFFCAPLYILRSTCCMLSLQAWGQTVKAPLMLLHSQLNE